MNHEPEQAIDFSDVFCYARGMANNDASIVSIPDERIIRKIYLIRGKKVMFDQHLADLYDVEPRVLVQAVKRNLDRFPQDFMFQLSDSEAQTMRSQFVIASRRNIRYRPYGRRFRVTSKDSNGLKNRGRFG